MLGVLCCEEKTAETELTSFLASVRLLLVEMATFMTFLCVCIKSSTHSFLMLIKMLWQG